MLVMQWSSAQNTLDFEPYYKCLEARALASAGKDHRSAIVCMRGEQCLIRAFHCVHPLEGRLETTWHFRGLDSHNKVAVVNVAGHDRYKFDDDFNIVIAETEQRDAGYFWQMIHAKTVVVEVHVTVTPLHRRKPVLQNHHHELVFWLQQTSIVIAAQWNDWSECNCEGEANALNAKSDTLQAVCIMYDNDKLAVLVYGFTTFVTRHFIVS